jgi:hypothetical protein
MAISYAERYAIIELGRQHPSSAPDPGDWISVVGNSGPTRHFLFYLRDETFECSAAAWQQERVVR